MANVLMKTRETIEVSDEDMLLFLPKNRDLIQVRHSSRRRAIKQEDEIQISLTSTK